MVSPTFFYFDAYDQAPPVGHTNDVPPILLTELSFEWFATVTNEEMVEILLTRELLIILQPTQACSLRYYYCRYPIFHSRSC